MRAHAKCSKGLKPFGYVRCRLPAACHASTIDGPTYRPDVAAPRTNAATSCLSALCAAGRMYIMCPPS